MSKTNKTSGPEFSRWYKKEGISAMLCYAMMGLRWLRSRGTVVGPHDWGRMVPCGGHIYTKGHFTHETESPWPSQHFRHSILVVDRAELVQVQGPLHARRTDGGSVWMQDGYQVYMDSCMASIGSCFMVTWIIFKKPFLGGTSNTKPGDHGTPNVHNCWFILFYHAWGPTWIGIHWDSIWLRAWSHMTSH